MICDHLVWRDSSFCDTCFENDLLATSIGILPTLDGGSERSRRVDKVPIIVEMKHGLVLIANFYPAKIDGVIPSLGVYGSETGGIEQAVQNSMPFADVKSVVVLTVHEMSMVDL